MADPLVSAVISTRNRAATLGRAVETVLANEYPRFEVIVVDQGDDDQSEEALSSFSGDRRLRHLRTSSRGQGRGLNIGISGAGGAIVAITDDDCEVPTDWLDALVRVFAGDPEIGVIFGNVVAGDHDRAVGFVPAYVRSDTVVARTIRDKHKIEGMGACMAVRRDVWDALSGFDEAFGAGSEFRSSADLDLAIRALSAGHAVCETPVVWVTHRGFRTWDSTPALLEDYFFGTGGSMVKQLKCRNWGIVTFLVRLAVRWAFRSPGVDFGRRPPRGIRLSAFARGFLTGLRCPVDQRGHFTQKGHAS